MAFYNTPSKEGAGCWDTAEMSFWCSGTKPCPAVLKQSLPFSSCSRCYSTDTRRRAGGIQPSAHQQGQSLTLPSAGVSLPGLMSYSGGQLGVAGRGQLPLQVLEHVEWKAADHSDG